MQYTPLFLKAFSLIILFLTLIVMANEQRTTNKLLTVLIKQNQPEKGVNNEKN